MCGDGVKVLYVVVLHGSDSSFEDLMTEQKDYFDCFVLHDKNQNYSGLKKNTAALLIQVNQ